jgi:O-antigen ligase
MSWESLRPWPVYLTAAMIPFSLAATNLFKLLMVLFTLIALGVDLARHERLPVLRQLRTPAVAVLMLAALAVSLAYTTAPLHDALHELNKYSKLLLIPLALVLLRQRREAVLALGCYVVAESFVVLTSYLLTMGLDLPWVIKPLAVRIVVGTAYSSYLDQSIMTAGLAALAWHLRHEFPGRFGPRIAIGLVLLCAVNVLLLLPGRSAQVALLVAMAMALFWAVPRRARPAAVLLPLLVALSVTALSTHFKDRVAAVLTESVAYSHGDRTPTSSGIRLGFWYRSLQAIAEQPLTGFGVGSWNGVYKRLEAGGVSPEFAEVRNPHQEYLLWGVQLGVGGIALFLAYLLALLRDAVRFPRDIRHATRTFVTMFAVVCLFNSALFDALIGDYFCLIPGLLLALGSLSPTGEAGT